MADLTNEEYAVTCNKCPKCKKSHQLQADEINADTATMTRLIICKACGFSFNEIFRLVGWEAIKS